ncbi:XRE family transcriptional regulator [Magnetofaba australis]|uniref:XRE family transcriptional regulator n=1 Tax=Magnetofaba australis TaxID=1472297 RepID=UPI000A19F3B0|nr:helix-turn-helix transcriptional regulator [Magnetofaba australis]
MSTFATRLREARTALKLSQMALAKRARVSQGLIHKLEHEGDGSTTRLLQIAEALNVRPEWLANGEEPRRWGSPKLMGADEAHLPKGAPQKTEPTAHGYTLIPRFSVEASAGSGNEILQEEVLDRLAFQTAWLEEKNLDPRFLGIIQAMGDSMTPTLCDGDTLLVSMNQRQAMDGRIFVLRSSTGLFVKRLRILPGKTQLISDNDKYPPYEISADQSDQWEIIGRVIWVGRELL